MRKVLVAPDGSGDAIGLSAKLAYGVGGGVMNFCANAVTSLAHPVFIITLGVNPLWIGAALAIARLFDAFVDTMIGHWSDQLRTRFGRRRPVMALGAVGLGLTFAILWWMPRGWPPGAIFAWFCVGNVIYLFCHGLFTVPWSALGSELTHGYDERTALNAYSGLGQKLSGLAVAWLFPFIELGFFADAVQGVRALGLIAGCMIICAALVPVFVLREPPTASVAASGVPERRESLMSAVRVVAGSKLFWRFAGITLCQSAALIAVYNLGTYINIYYVFRGDKAAAAHMVGITLTFFNILGIVSIPLVNLLSRRIGKHRALGTCLGFMIVASALKFFLYRPEMPYLQLGVFVFQAPGQAAFAVLLSSMLADFIDHDELRTGTRRAALIMSANGWVAKVGTAAAFFVSGLVLILAGFDAARGVEQAPGVIFHLRLAYAAVPLVGTAVALWLVRGYPLNKKAMDEVRVGLAQAGPQP